MTTILLLILYLKTKTVLIHFGLAKTFAKYFITQPFSLKIDQNGFFDEKN